MTSSMDDKMNFVNASDFNQILEDDLEGNLSSTKTKSPASLNIQGPSTSNIQTSINLGSSFKPDLVSTLDEPVSVTIKRDLSAVCYKLGHVFFPKKSNLLLRDWDLWGPLTLCVFLSILLQSNTNEDKNAPEFASLFALITMGAIVVTINTKLLSGKISFFQSICVLGYCLLPLVLAAGFHEILLKISGIQVWSFTIHFIISCVACVWSVFASTAFLAADTINLTDRKALAIFPMFLFYFVITWLVILDTN